MANKNDNKTNSKPNIIKGGFIKVMGNEKWQPLTIPLFSILLSLIVASIIFLILGKNPISAFHNLLQGSGVLSKPNYASYKSALTDFMTLLDAMTPLLFASLAVTVAMRQVYLILVHQARCY